MNLMIKQQTKTQTQLIDELARLRRRISELEAAAAKQTQTQAALQQSEERFRQVISSISDHIYVSRVTREGDFINLYLSPHVETLTGYPRERAMADWHFWALELIHPADRDTAAAQAKRLAKGQNSEVEYRLVRANGEVIWVRDSARVQDEGETKIIYGVVGNITGRKQAEAEIRKLNEELEQRVVDRTRELSALYEVTAVASEALNLETMLERALERVLVAMRSKRGAIHLLDESGQNIELAAHQGLPAEAVAQLGFSPANGPVPAWVLEPGEPVLISNLAARTQLSPPGRKDDLQTYLGAPMRASGQVLGVLSVFGESDQQFNVEDVALLASIADQVGVTVENARLHQRTEQAAIMEERARLARELHDSVTQSLYSLTLLAGGWRRLAGTGNLENVGDYLGELEEIAKQALKEMRLLVYQLRPTALEQEGLVGALQQRLDAVEGRAGVKTRLLVEKSVKLPPALEEGLFRITQEALSNALKHAAASSVTVRLTGAGPCVTLEVTDDGQGFEPGTVTDSGGLGLISMRERAEKLGGSLKVHSKPGQGTKIEVQVKIARNV